MTIRAGKIYRACQLAVFFLLLLPCVSFPEEPIKENPPYGFRDIPWGANLSTFPPMRYVRDAEAVFEGWTTYWIRENEKKNIGPIKCNEIEYKAFFNLMYGVTIEIDVSDCFLMSQILTKAHGKEPTFKTVLDEEWFEGCVRYQWYWDFENSYIRMWHLILEKGDLGLIEIVSKKIEKNADDYMRMVVKEKRKLDVETGVNDLKK